MPSLLETLNAPLADRRAVVRLATRIGGDDDETASAVGPALAKIIDGLATLAADGRGVRSIDHLVDQHGTTGVDLTGQLDKASTDDGNSILDRVFGAERGLVVIGLASALGLAPSLVGRLLPVLAPLVVAELARRCLAEDLDGQALAELLAEDRRAISQAGLLDGTTFDAGRLETSTGVTSGDEERGGDQRGADRLGIRRRAGLTPSTGVVALETIGGATEVETDVVSSGASASGSIAAAEADAAPAPDAEMKVGVEVEVEAERSDGVRPQVDVDNDSPVGDGDGDDDRVTDHRADQTDDDAPPAGALAWLGWAIGAVILVLLLAWLLSTCGAAASQDQRAASVVTIAPGRVGEEAAIAGPDRGPGAGQRVGSGDASSPEPAAPVVAEGQRDRGASLSGSVTEAEFQGAVNAILRDSGVTGVVTGDLVTLTGVVEGEQRRDDLEANVGVLLGVAAIDNRVTIAKPEPAPEPDPADPAEPQPGPGAGAEPPAEQVAAGTTLNDLLPLPPVTFASGSPELTDEGLAVLDQVAAHLIGHPDLAIEIGGHTDSDGAEDANLQLSQQRADAVGSRLVAAGVDQDRLTAVGYGEAEPVVANDSLDNKAMNRRIEFVVR